MAGPPTADKYRSWYGSICIRVQYGNVLIASGAVTSLSAITRQPYKNGEIQVNYSSNYDMEEAMTSKTISAGKQAFEWEIESEACV